MALPAWQRVRMPFLAEPDDVGPPLPQALSSSALDAMRREAGGRDPEEAAAWFRLRRDRYVPADEWARMSAAARLRLMVDVVAAAGGRPRPFSDCSAAAVWDIPVIGPVPDQVEVVVPDGRRGRSPGVIRHRSQNCPRGVVHDGVLVTPAARTAVDLARRRSLACGVAAMDDVLHRGLATREDLVREREAIPRGGRGRQRARLAVALADGLSESAGESLSRVRMYELGFPRPALQQELVDRSGTFVARADFLWKNTILVGEFDGRLKYRVPRGADNPAAGDVVWREKRREDALRRLGFGVARWVWDDALSPSRLQAVLLGHGLRPAHDRSWLDRF